MVGKKTVVGNAQGVNQFVRFRIVLFDEFNALFHVNHFKADSFLTLKKTVVGSHNVLFKELLVFLELENLKTFRGFLCQNEFFKGFKTAGTGNVGKSGNVVTQKFEIDIKFPVAVEKIKIFIEISVFYVDFTVNF